MHVVWENSLLAVNCVPYEDFCVYITPCLQYMDLEHAKYYDSCALSKVVQQIQADTD